MKIYCNPLRLIAKNLIDNKKAEGTYRDFLALSTIAGGGVKFPYFRTPAGDRVLHMCLNDYLGMSQSSVAKLAAIEGIRSLGVGTGASRNIGGTRQEHQDLEAELCSLHFQDDCLLYTSGNAACTDVITGIARLSASTKFFSDTENHASLIEGMRGLELGKRKFIFTHNDLTHLNALVSRNLKPGDIPVLVVETLYSMSGSYAPISEMVPLFKSLGGLIILNEVHAVGIHGDEGGGFANENGILSDVDLIIGSLSKAYGVFGGYVVGRSELIDYFRQTGVRSIFTTSLPHYICAAALANVRQRRSEYNLVQELKDRVRYLRSGLAMNSIVSLGDQNSHITPILIGDEKICLAIAEFLLKEGFYVTPIRFPTVPIGKALIRIIVTPHHDYQEIHRFCEVLGNLYKMLDY